MPNRTQINRSSSFFISPLDAKKFFRLLLAFSSQRHSTHLQSGTTFTGRSLAWNVHEARQQRRANRARFAAQNWKHCNLGLSDSPYCNTSFESRLVTFSLWSHVRRISVL